MYLGIENIFYQLVNDWTVLPLLLISSDTLIHPLGFLVGIDVLNLRLGISFLSILIIIDILIYTIVSALKDRKFIQNALNSNLINKNKQKILSILEDGNKKNILILFIIKVLPGSRIGILLYSIYKNDKVLTFIKNILIVNICLFIPLFISGYLIGIGINNVFLDFKLIITLIYFLLIFSTLYLFKKQIKNLLNKLFNK